jgi:hypothetical protein
VNIKDGSAFRISDASNSEGNSFNKLMRSSVGISKEVKRVFVLNISRTFSEVS